ncbi:MAG TPA: hypothetical protein VG146_13970 [Verrucomicrobiae bacterium]|nr:hypothetical protein [Verrucomicrobiae bacterium]
MRAPAGSLTECSRLFKRIAGHDWWLTKQVYIFSPQEMQDLEFQPAVDTLKQLLPLPEGSSAAGLFYECGADSLPSVLSEHIGFTKR